MYLERKDKMSHLINSFTLWLHSWPAEMIIVWAKVPICCWFVLTSVAKSQTFYTNI